MSDKRVALIGATGLVGRTVLEKSVGLPGIRLGAVARREISLPAGARMELIVADPAGWNTAIEALAPETLICALGTTWRKAGRVEEAFRSVDHDLVLSVAEAAKAAGVRHMIAVSSAGADRANRNLYLRVKGEVEQALMKLRFARLDILQPGLIRGRRKGDMRLLEKLGMIASPISDLFLLGKLRRFHSIPVGVLGDAILSLAREKAAGRFIHDYDSLLRAARRFAR